MELKKRVEQLLARIAAMQIPIYAGNASFFLLLSVFPIVSLLLSLLPYTPLTLEHLLGFCAQLAPDWLMRLLEYFIRTLYKSSSAAIISVSVVLTLWSASKGMLSLLYGLDAVLEVRETRRYLRRRLLCVLYTVGMLLALLLTLGLYVGGQDEFIKALGGEEFQKRLDHAENSFFFELRQLQKNYDLSDPEQKTAFHREIARKLCTFSEEVERENYIEAVAQKYHISFENLRRLVGTYAAQTGLAQPVIRPKSGVQKKNTAAEGIKNSQKLLLTWLVEQPQLYHQISKYVFIFTPEQVDISGDTLDQVKEQSDTMPTINREF